LPEDVDFNSITIDRYFDGLIRNKIIYKMAFLPPTSPYNIGSVHYGTPIRSIDTYVTTLDKSFIATTRVAPLTRQIITPYIMIYPYAPEYLPTFCNPEFQDYTILYSHGNGEDLAQMVQLMQRLSSELGIACCCYDYTGYGPSTAEPNENDCYINILTMFHHLIHREHRDPSKIVLFGRSIGSGPTIHLAQYLSVNNYKFGGVFLQSPFESVVGVVSKKLAYIVPDIFENIHKINKVTRPVAILHAEDDDVVPIADSERLVEKIPNLYRFERISESVGAGHQYIEHLCWRNLLVLLWNFIEHIHNSK
jgi:pimeloyl-ACP methyl ester carboxylesterase